MTVSRRQFLAIGLGGAAALMLPAPVRAASHPMNVWFVNPGRSDEDFWVSVSAVMRAAANDLGINLRIGYGERSPLNTIRVGQQMVGEASPGDYLIVGNEDHTAGPIFEAAIARGLKVLIAFNGFSGDEVTHYGRPRGLAPEFLGEILPDNVAAGASIARGLISAASAAGRPLRLIGINGNPDTPAAADRERGLRQVLDEHADASLRQVISTDWTRADGARRALGLLERYPDTNIVWCANDPIALGVLDIAKNLGRNPGRDLFIGGLNWLPEALGEIRDGRLVLSVGGHFMTGGWALVLLRDYHDGLDFADAGGLTLSVPFNIIDRSNLAAWERKYGARDWSRIGFRRFSRYFAGRRGPYDFSIEALLG